MNGMRRVANTHKRSIQFDLTILADTQEALIHRLKTLVDAAESGDLGENRNGSVGGRFDDSEFAIRTRE